MEPPWVQQLRNHLAAHAKGSDRTCTVRWHGDAIQVRLPSGAEVAVIRNATRHATCQELKSQLAAQLSISLSQLKLYRGPTEVQDAEEAGSVDGVVLQEQGVALREQCADLLPFQKDAVQFAIQRHGRVLLGHEMGLGKTAMALAIVAHYREEWPVLVVAPPVLLDQWVDEIVKWLPEVSRSEVQLVRKPTMVRQKELVPIEIRPTAKFVLVSYNMLTGQMKKTARGSREQTNSHLRAQPSGSPYRVVIADEAHALKSVDSQRTRTLLPLLHLAPRVVLMTGTPMPNSSAADVLPLLHAVAGARAPTPRFMQWCEHYCAENRPIWTGYREIPRWIGVNRAREKELHGMLSLAMVRKLKVDVLAELPAKRRAKVRLEVSAAEMRKVKAQQAHVQDLKNAMTAVGEDEGAEEEAGLPTHELMQIFKLLAEAKQGAVCDWLEASYLDGRDPAASDGKVLIFAHHMSVHQKLADFLKEKLGDVGDRWIHITGGTSTAARTEQLDRFKKVDRCHFAVLALQACGAGLDLSIADTCVFAELCWTPSALEQAEARAHRMGQQATSVMIYYLVAGGSDSPDEIMFNALQRKADVATRVVDGTSASSSAQASQLLTPKRRRRVLEDSEGTPVKKKLATTVVAGNSESALSACHDLSRQAGPGQARPWKDGWMDG